MPFQYEKTPKNWNQTLHINTIFCQVEKTSEKKDKFTAQLEVFHFSLLILTSHHSCFDLFPDLPALLSVYFIQTCR